MKVKIISIGLNFMKACFREREPLYSMDRNFNYGFNFTYRDKDFTFKSLSVQIFIRQKFILSLFIITVNSQTITIIHTHNNLCDTYSAST